jgi:hypothetical protein
MSEGSAGNVGGGGDIGNRLAISAVKWFILFLIFLAVVHYITSNV